MKILAFAGSPRRHGNTRILLDGFLSAVSREGREVELIDLSSKDDFPIAPCLGCDACLSGCCVQDDGMQVLYPKLRSADLIILSAPIYFYGLPAKVKAVIDRCQLFFNQKYKKGMHLREKPGKGIFISCAATSGRRVFDGAVLTVRYWFDALDVKYAGDSLFRGIDEAGAILSRPEALEEVKALARSITL